MVAKLIQLYASNNIYNGGKNSRTYGTNLPCSVIDRLGVRERREAFSRLMEK